MSCCDVFNDYEANTSQQTSFQNLNIKVQTGYPQKLPGDFYIFMKDNYFLVS